jgi:hypothetical protein
LVIDDKLRHKAVGFFDTTLLKIPRKTKILPAGTTGDAGPMRARPPYHRNNQVAYRDARNLRPYRDHLPQRFVPNDKLRGSWRRRSVLERADFFVRAANPGLYHSQLHIVRRGYLRLRLIDDADFSFKWGNGNCFHQASPSIRSLFCLLS